MMRQRGEAAAAGQARHLTAKVDGMNATILHGCIRLIVLHLYGQCTTDYVTWVDEFYGVSHECI